MKKWLDSSNVKRWAAEYSRPSLFFFGVSISLHVLLIVIAAKTIMSGQRLRENSHVLQMTLYVGIGEAKEATPPAIPKLVPPPIQLAPRIDASKSQPGSGSIGDAIPKAGLADKADDIRDESPSTFLPSSEMDLGAVPVSEPDSRLLVGVESSGLPIRLRLYVDKYGVVKDIHVLQVDDMDAPAVERLESMFYATTFIPARREGRDMSSYMDIEVNIADFNGVAAAPTAPRKRHESMRSMLSIHFCS
ncbi:hypothetical protein [Collimonas arenae]|uniref:hypothetical protein n=1 Tax=Collimonas arenae TaxID=279058 RepID=UPI0007788BD7|nr:hypothetical protein [Collimonas arenae]